jgi:hypothetical protein
MAEINRIDSQVLADAVVAWTGYERATYPTRDDAALINILPGDEATKLTAIVKALENDFYRSEAHATASNLSEMKDIATSDFRRLHPGLPEIIAEAFAWCYTFDYK